MTPLRARLAFALMTGAALMVGCARQAETIPEQTLDSAARPHLPFATTGTTAIVTNRAVEPARRAFLQRGQSAIAATPQHDGGIARGEGGTFTLNFDNADIHDVAKAVLGDMLQLGYAVAPGVQGSLSLHSAKPLTREEILPALENAFATAGAALVQQGESFAIVPLAAAPRAAGLSAATGYRVALVPLRYVAAAEMQRLIEPIVATGTVIQTDAQRNILMVGGADPDIARVKQLVSLFDVNWLRSQSFGLFPLKYAQARQVAADLQGVIGQGPMAGQVRILPIEHMNAVLVVAPRATMVEDLRGWADRFDRGQDNGAPRVFVYHVQHGRAGDIAAVLTRALGPRTANAGAETAPPPDAAADHSFAPAPAAPPAGANPLLGGLTPAAGGATADMPLGDIRITADDTNNDLIIVSTEDKYRLIEQALQQLDAMPVQVMLEACVAEVDLMGELKYGLQYYFRNGNFSLLRSAVLPGSIGADTGGLSLAFNQGNTIQAVLDLLASISKVKVISAPRVMVLNNRTASIDVGDEVPIATSTAVGVITANAPVVNTIQLLDTGIILRVTPRVGSSGMVLLDVDQEVSASVPTTSSSINSPTIQQRKINSSIAVQDGQTIAIGGLISDSRTNSRNGVPWLMDLPYVGALFSVKDTQVKRTELIVLITPRVVASGQQASDVTEELSRKMPLIQDMQATRGRPK